MTRKQMVGMVAVITLLVGAFFGVRGVGAFGITSVDDAMVDWSRVQNDATMIAQQGAMVQMQAQQIQSWAAMLQSQESDPALLEQIGQVMILATQMEADAATMIVTANDINTRIDNSEDTMLALSDDIGEMADRIGEMADRILWTELQIGVMADRIVVSENLISSSSLTLAQMMQQSTETQQGTLTTLSFLNGDILMALSGLGF